MPRTSAAAPTLAFLGCGWATRIHSRVLRSLGGGGARRYASREPARAQFFDRSLGGDGSYAGYDAALADESVDAVVIATPPATHLDLAIAALAAGKHVIVEKPAFLSAADCSAARQAADAAGRRVLVAENYFYKPLRGALARLLANGVVGRPLFLQIAALRTQHIDGWREQGVPGAGALLEGGIHWINFLANLGHPIERVAGFEPGRNGRPDRSMLVVVKFAGGPVATLHYSWEVPALLRGLRISRLSGTAGAVTFETNGLFLAVHGTRRRLVVPSLRDISGYRAMWRDFLGVLRTGVSPQMTLELAERDLSLVEAIYASLA